MKKSLRDQRRAAGLCVQCGKSSDSYRCQTCRDKTKAAVKRSYEKRKTSGKCAWPGCDNKPKLGRVYCKGCSERSGKTARERRDAGLCNKCRKPAVVGTWLCESHRERALLRLRRYKQQLKMDVLERYGGAFCVGCPETDFEVLQVDHINGGGVKHIKQIGAGRLYQWLKDNGYPTGYRILCANCNIRAHRKKPFPNERKPESSTE